MKGLVRRLVSEFDAHSVERAIVASFASRLEVKAGTLMEIEDDIELADVRIVRELDSIEIADVETVVMLFEELIDSDEQNASGAVYTPVTIAQKLADLTVDGDTRSVIDPACGCGALLVQAAKRIADLSGRSIADLSKHVLFGVDLYEHNVRRASKLLALLSISRGEQPDEWCTNFAVGDSLSLDFRGTFGLSTWDAVIGNPPYVRIQTLPEEMRESARTWAASGKGNFNLYYPFLELACDLTADTGRWAMIVPNAFFSTSAAAPLRQVLASRQSITDVLDFKEHKVFEASAYTAIIAGTGATSSTVTYAAASSAEDLSPTSWLVDASTLTERPWSFLRTEDQTLIRQIRRHQTLLGDLVSIHGYPQTGINNRFILDGDTTNSGMIAVDIDGRRFAVEQEITVAAASLRDIQTQEDLARSRSRIIWPYTTGEGGSAHVIAEQDLRGQFPGAYEYLRYLRPELEARDRGRKEYAAWYAYSRTQNLIPAREGVYMPAYGREVRAIAHRDHVPRFSFNGYTLQIRPGVELSDGVPLTVDLLWALIDRNPLLQRVMDLQSTKISGGYTRYLLSILKCFPVPSLGSEQAQELVLCSDRQTRTKLISSMYLG